MPAGLPDVGRGLVVAGLVLVVLGLVFMASGKIPWIGRLPGDIHVERGHFTFYFPVVTCLLASLLLSLLFRLFRG